MMVKRMQLPDVGKLHDKGSDCVPPNLSLKSLHWDSPSTSLTYSSLP